MLSNDGSLDQATREGPKRPTKARVIALAVLLLVAGVSGYAVLGLNHHPTGGARSHTVPAADGPTFREALTAVNGTVQDTPAGPWDLISVIGIAAQALYSPMAIGSFYDNLSMKYCSGQFNGLTIWNGTSFPIFDGSIASGTAPFWQFGYDSSTTGDVIVATDVSWIPRVYPPISSSSDCAVYSGLAGEIPEYASWLSPLPIDTPRQAANASRAIGDTFEAANKPLVELFSLGYTPFTDATNHGGNGVGLGVEFSRCGLVGSAGFEPEAVAGEAANGSVADIFTGDLSCTAVRNATSTPVQFQNYSVAFSKGSSAIPVGSASSGLQLPFEVDFPDWYVNGTPYTDGWGLTSWMTNLTLTGSDTEPLPDANASCTAWAAALTDCSASRVGWSVVLVSADGEWLDEYPSTTNQSTWEYANAPLVSNEALVLIAPGSWDLSGDSLLVNGASAIPFVSGMIGL